MYLRAVVALLVSFTMSCAGPVESSIKVNPPTPAPAVAPTPTTATPPPPPSDEDGDGVVAGDRCPNEKETPNGYEDADGCPDEVPDFYVKGHDVVYSGELKFGLLGGLMSSSQPIIEGIAALMAKHADLELVEVSAHVIDGSDHDKKSRTRADAVVKALVKAGVETKRLRAAGYGKRCPDGGTRVELKVVRRGGAETGVALCGR